METVSVRAGAYFPMASGGFRERDVTGDRATERKGKDEWWGECLLRRDTTRQKRPQTSRNVKGGYTPYIATTRRRPFLLQKPSEKEK